MATTTTSLWPEEIRASVKSPLTILLEQADALTNQTGGVLVGKVTKGTSDDDQIMLGFNIVVPELDGYCHRIMLVTHQTEMNYPAIVDAETFRPSMNTAMGSVPYSTSWSAITKAVGVETKKPVNRADTDKELVELVSRVLRSPSVVSVAQSLISRAADLRAGREAQTESVSPHNSTLSGPRSEPGRKDISTDSP